MQVPVTQFELEYGVNAGIGLRVLGEDMVPIHEEHEARLERGISVGAWLAMDELERGLIIAVRRTRIAIENLNTEAQIKKMQKDIKK